MLAHEIARLALGYAPRANRYDGILGFSEHLTSALDARPDIAAQLLLRERRAAWSSPDGAEDGSLPLSEALRRTGASDFVLQYNPFSYGHWGLAPGLVAELVAARRRGVLSRFVLVVHEPYVVLPGWRFTLMGAIQRRQLAALMHLADTILTTSETYVVLLASVHANAGAVAIPAGSNMPDRRAAREATRSELGASAQTLVVATFGMAHPQQLVGHVTAAVQAALEDGHEIVLLSLGHTTDAVELQHPRLRILQPGPLDADELARFMASADLFLAPYSDGVTTRRTTLMAALRQGLCIVSTRGDTQHSSLREPALGLVPASDLAAFATLARTLAGDVVARRRYGVAARDLYERSYSWDAIAEQFVHAVGQSS